MIRFSGAIWARARRLRRRIALFVGSLLCLDVGWLASFTSPTSTQQQKEITTAPLLSTTTTSAGQIVLPQAEAQLVASLFDIPPHAYLPEQLHPYPRFGYILSGNLRVMDTETGRSKTYESGDFVLERLGRWHSGANSGGEPTRVLVIDLVEKGATRVV